MKGEQRMNKNRVDKSRLVLGCIAMFIGLGALEVVEGARTVVVYLGFYLIFQAVVGILFFNKTMRNY